MKNFLSIKALLLIFSSLILVISCQSSAEKSEVTTDSSTTTTTKQNSSDGKNTKAKGNTTKWNADAAKAKANFSVKGPFGVVHGDLSGLKSTILFDEKDLNSSSFKASVDPKTISTGIKLRNKDLQKEKYLDSDDYPAISFHSDKIEKSGNGYKAIGDLTLKGVTRRVEIPFDFTETGNTGVFKGHFTIKREDYKVGNDGGSIGSTVTIDLEVPVTKS